MPAFSTALQQVLSRSYGDKIAALAQASGMHGPDIGRLIKEEGPLSAAKLAKLTDAEGMTADDKTLLIHAAVRDFIGENEYKSRFAPDTQHEDNLGGVVFRSLFPLRPKAARTLRYLVQKAGVDGDVASVLEIIGNMLELPENDTPPGADVEALIDEAAKEIRDAKPPGKKSGKSGKSA